jgi:hypothetical protein
LRLVWVIQKQVQALPLCNLKVTHLRGDHNTRSGEYRIPKEQAQEVHSHRAKDHISFNFGREQGCFTGGFG